MLSISGAGRSLLKTHAARAHRYCSRITIPPYTPIFTSIHPLRPETWDLTSSSTALPALLSPRLHSVSQVVVLPECWTGLYGVQCFRGHAEDLDLINNSKRNWTDSGAAVMREAATKHGVYVCGGLIEREGGGAQPQVGAEPVLYNTIAAYGPSGDEVARYRKMHLSRVRVGPDATAEGDMLTPGEDLAFFDVAAGDARSGSGSGEQWQ